MQLSNDTSKNSTGPPYLVKNERSLRLTFSSHTVLHHLFFVFVVTKKEKIGDNENNNNNNNHFRKKS